MVIIGIAGSTGKRRDVIADKAAAAKLCRLVAMALYTPDPGSHDTARDSRATRIVEVAQDLRKTRHQGVIFSQVRSEQEAQRLRDMGGVMWHAEGVPSREVVIRRGDLLVTDVDGGHRHYLDPIEALSQTLLNESRKVAS